MQYWYWVWQPIKVLPNTQYSPILEDIGQYPIPQCQYRSNPSEQLNCYWHWGIGYCPISSSIGEYWVPIFLQHTLTSLAVKTSVTRPAFSVPKAVRTSVTRPVFLNRKGADERRGRWMYPISAAGNRSLRRLTGDLLGLSISRGRRHPWFQPPTDQAWSRRRPPDSRGSKQWHDVWFISWLSKFV